MLRVSAGLQIQRSGGEYQKTPKQEIEKALKIKEEYEFENSIRNNK